MFLHILNELTWMRIVWAHWPAQQTVQGELHSFTWKLLRGSVTSQLTSYGIFLNWLAFYRPPPPSIFIHSHSASSPLMMYQMCWWFLLPYCPQDFTDLTASSASFIPTVTAISTSPDLQWMVQPLISSVAPSHRAHPYSPSPTYTRPGMRSASKAHTSNKRGRVEQVITTWPCFFKCYITSCNFHAASC